MKKLLCAVFAVLASWSSAIGQTIIAQYTPGGVLPVATFPGTGNGIASQTFTAQGSGYLYSAEAWLSQFQSDPLPTTVIAEIRTTTGGLTDTGGGAVVAAASVAGSSMPAYATPSYVTFDFSSSSYSLVSGNVYALVLYGTGSSGSIAWMGSNGGGYANGALYNWNGSSFAASVPASLDAKFRVSVTATPVPEPSTYALLTGLGALLALCVRRQSSAS